MTEKIKEALDYIIQNKEIKTVFQPIVSLRDGSILGHEALSRITCECEIKNPEVLFALAGDYNRLWELELICRTKALEAAYKYLIPPYSKKLFINVNPDTIHDEKFKKGFTKTFLEQYNIAPDNVIFEITERNVITDIPGFTEAIEHYKSQDYQIAIDDAGAGYSGLNLISEVNPHFIKLDMKLIQGVDTDSIKFALIKGMVEFSKASDICLIAEGIETYGELEVLINLGVQYGQGYYIQKPDEEIRETDREVLNSIRKLNCKKNNESSSIFSNIYIKSLCTYTVVISPFEIISDVYEIFKQNPDYFGLCVIDNQMPVGIITREKLFLKLSGQYGFTLYQNKPVSEIMDNEFLSVDYSASISEVSSIAMSRPSNKLYDFIVVTEGNRYVGTVTIRDLLIKTTELEVMTAKNQNPLSGLPGNFIIEQKLLQCVSNMKDYTICYFDIDNFKAYNDAYGFEKGDLVIKLLADILKNTISDDNLVGHIGGDDFVVVMNRNIEEDYFRCIVNRFEREAKFYYNERDIKNGYITANNRYGELEKFPLVTLTYVLVTNHTKQFDNIFDLTYMLSDLKKAEKYRKYGERGEIK